MQCVNNLKQQGLAAMTFESTYGTFPAAYGPYPVATTGTRSNVVAQLLPFIESSNAYSAFNFQINMNLTGDTSANATAQSQIVGAYVCPSDPTNLKLVPTGATVSLGYTNYFASTGASSSPVLGTATYMEPNAGLGGIYTTKVDTSAPLTLPNGTPNSDYQKATGSSIAAITDGTSNTAAFSESILGKSATTASIGGFTGGISVYDRTNVYYLSTLDTNIAPTCTYNGAGYAGRITYRGQQYYRALPMTAHYSHTLAPNSTLYDCGSSDFVRAHMAARSNHPGGVNAVFGDGSVRFAKSTINPQVWNSLGSKGAGEIISADAF